MVNPRWQGIFPAITTKLHADESIDAAGTARHIDFQIRNGIHGLVTRSSLGEASTLTLEEKLDVTRIAIAACAGRIPVLANVSETSTREALRFIAGGNALGVDDLAFEGLALGCDGLLAGVGCTFPRETVALYEHITAGRYAQALKLYQWMTPLLHLDVSTKLVQNLKLIDLLVGVGTEHMRRPRLPLVGAESAFIERRWRRRWRPARSNTSRFPEPAARHAIDPA